MSMPKIININGIGPVVDQPLFFKTDKLHYWQGGGNDHNETSVSVLDGKTQAGDTTKVSFFCGEKACTLTVDMNSRAGVPLFNEGMIHYTFDRMSKQWSMNASKTTGMWFWEETSDWKFCSPGTVVDQTLAILGHIRDGRATDISVGGEPMFVSGLFEVFLSPVMESLKRSKNTMIQGASIYTTRPECTHIPISEQPGYENNPYGSGAFPD